VRLVALRDQVVLSGSEMSVSIAELVVSVVLGGCFGVAAVVSL
jgi:hypothetical protein